MNSFYIKKGILYQQLKVTEEEEKLSSKYDSIIFDDLLKLYLECKDDEKKEKLRFVVLDMSLQKRIRKIVQEEYQEESNKRKQQTQEKEKQQRKDNKKRQNRIMLGFDYDSIF